MSWSTAVGLVLAFVVLIATNLLEGGNPLKLLNGPGAVIVFGGTFVAALISFPPQLVTGLPKTIGCIFKQKPVNLEALIGKIVEMADKARRQGLLALEEEAAKLDNEYLKMGIQLVVDGTDPEVVKSLLEVETEQMEARHMARFGVLNAMGGYAPTMGIIGTVMGLVSVLGHMEDPSKLAGSIATAFLATFYGVASANLIWMPLGSKLKAANEEEVLVRSIMAEGVLSIQSGDNPRVVASKLEAFLSPSERKREKKPAAGEGK